VVDTVRRRKDETVLVVGHITVTGVIAALGRPILPTSANVISVYFCTPAGGGGGLVRLRYGAPEDISRNCNNPVRGVFCFIGGPVNTPPAVVELPGVKIATPMLLTASAYGADPLALGLAT
jgi:hypothetical protein